MLLLMVTEMDDVINFYRHLRDTSLKFSSDVYSRLNISDEDYPNGIFNKCFNLSTVALEVFGFYHAEWLKKRSCNGASEELRQETVERIIMIQKMFFVETISIVEEILKTTFLNSDSVFDEADKYPFVKPKPNRLYLYNIMKTTHKKGNLTDAEMELWVGIIRLRNCIVHNNAVAEETFTYNFPGVSLVLEDKKMARGNELYFGKLTEWVLINVKKWILLNINKV